MKFSYQKYILSAVVFSLSSFIFAQTDSSNASDIEEIVVVGSQIKGAKITGALPVSIISSEDIESLGVDSGDELLDNIAELGQNTFNQNEFSGGYNASRGDVGAFNLRDIEMAYLSAGIALFQSSYNLIESNATLTKLTGGIIQEYGSEQ